MRAAAHTFLFLLGTSAAAILNSRSQCAWKENLTSSEDFRRLGTNEITALETCLYYYLYEKEFERSGDINSFHFTAPPEDKIVIDVENVFIHQVTLEKSSSYQFNIVGDISVNWEDSRLVWNSSEWHMDQFALHDTHHIWTPTLIDHSLCEDPTKCYSHFDDVEVMTDGRVYASITFRYLAYCSVDFYKYPEEENSCCLFLSTLSSYDTKKDITFNLETDEQTKLKKDVTIGSPERELSSLVQDHSAWTVDSRQVNVVKVGSISPLQVLRICVHAEKRMSTLRMALRFPVTIATLLMLVAPLFGDLKIQIYVKLLTLTLQTICFLFLCSIAPENGFAGTKPKIYTFYETVFSLTLLSVFVTLTALALSRVSRSVPPTHRLYLLAKLVNRVVCCMEPEPGVAYQRHLDEDSGVDSARPHSQVDYTHDWRHIYVAANNLFSGISFTIFLFVAVFDIL